MNETSEIAYSEDPDTTTVALLKVIRDPYSVEIVKPSGV